MAWQAAAAKAAVAVVKDPKLRNFVFGIILVVLLIVVAPIAVLLGISDVTTSLNLDDPDAQQQIIDRLSPEQRAALQTFEIDLLSIETKMADAGHGARVREAQMLYLAVLYKTAPTRSEWLTQLVDCFADDPDASTLVQRFNTTFGTEIGTEEFEQAMSLVKKTYIDTSQYTDLTTKNSTDLVIWAQNALDAGWGYVWGTHGEILTESRLSGLLGMYPDELGEKEEFIRQTWLGSRVSDCSGFVKGYGWYNAETQQFDCGANGAVDQNANTMYSTAAVKGSMDTMPDTPGLAVWYDGHMGIYIGNGEVIHAANTELGVCKTTIASGGWQGWFEVPWVNYVETAEETGGEIP